MLEVEDTRRRRGTTRALSIAPMMDRTDRHLRWFLRQLTRQTLLYTEMVTTPAILRGRRLDLLAFSPEERPLALQLGGDDPRGLAACARIAEDLGYDEVNINVGCPSDKVQRGRFGACLMAEPALVGEMVEAMRQATTLPVTVKHRIGIDDRDAYDDMRRFIDTVAAAGADRFTVHARKAWLTGLSPKENRTVPPLRYETVARLKRDFPRLTIVLNGGLRDHATALAQLSQVDGVMIGREACDNPWMLAEVDVRYFGQPSPCATRETVVDAMRPYLAREVAAGVPARAVVRPMIGLFNGLPGARNWRRALSDPSLLESAGPRILDRALQAMRAPSGAPRARTEEFQ